MSKNSEVVQLLRSNAGIIGSRVRDARKAMGWNLATLGERTAIPQSTLSKFETGSLSLPLDRVFRLADALGLAATELFDMNNLDTDNSASGRRSVSRFDDVKIASSRQYNSRWLFLDLLRKKMFPIVQEVLARNIDEFGPLIKHEGEEFTFVLEGTVQIITEIYEPVTLGKNDGIYIDSRMGHAYLNAGEGPALVLNTSTSTSDQFVAQQ